MAKAKQDSTGDNIKLEQEASSMSRIAAIVAVVGLGGAMVLGGGDITAFLRSYLTAFMYVLSLALGMLWFVCLQHLVNAKWSVAVRRVAEIIAASMPVVAIMSLPLIGPILMGNDAVADLYIWLDHAKVESNHLLHQKAAYLNKNFFVVRCVIYFGFWWWLSSYFFKTSVRQDKDGDKQLTSSMQVVSAPSMIALALTLTFCSFDFLMSLDPEWFSTIFGVYYFAGCVVSGYSLLALALMWVQAKGRLGSSVNEEHYHDIGKMMFAFTIFWAYIGFSQFMLIWYADIPEETKWFHFRFRGDWKWMSAALLVGHFVIPFLGLLSRHVKRNKKALGFWAVWLLVIHYVDIYWLVHPNGKAELPFGLVDVLCAIGLLGILVFDAARRAKGMNLIPTKDPRLADSLAFENV